MLNFSTIMIGTTDSKALADFYGKVLDKDFEWQDGDWYGFEIGQGHLAIGPHSEVTGSANEPQRLIMNWEADDVKKESERIKATGATVISDPFANGDPEEGTMVMSTFADPDGNYFQVCPKWEDA